MRDQGTLFSDVRSVPRAGDARVGTGHSELPVLNLESRVASTLALTGR